MSTRDDFVERAARHARRLFVRTRILSEPEWDDTTEATRQCWRADVAEVLDASGYPAALDEAAGMLRAIAADHKPEPIHRGSGPGVACRWCEYEWPCWSERARAWLAENAEQAT